MQTLNQCSGAPVFIVGHPRSGTTLAATLIGRHPSIAMPPETQFFAEVYREGAVCGKEQFTRALSNARIRDLALDQERLVADFDASAQKPKDVFELIIRSYGAKTGKKRPGEKSPNHIKWVEQLLGWFPDAKVICLKRDGRDVVNSLMSVPWSHKNIVKHSFDWVASQRRATELTALSANRFRIFRYEDLLRAPESVLEEICEFIVEPFDPAMLNAGTSDAVPNWESGWKQKAKLEIDPSNIGKWRERRYLDRLIMNTLMGTQLKRDGYKVDPTSIFLRSGVWLLVWPYHPKLRPWFSKIKSFLWRRAGSSVL